MKTNISNTKRERNKMGFQKGDLNYSRINVVWNKGKKMDDKFREKISISNKGKPTWNKGLKGFQVAWNKGLTKETDERVKKYTNSIKKTLDDNLIIRLESSKKRNIYYKEHPEKLKEVAIKHSRTLQENIEIRKKIGFAQKSKINSKETIQKIKEARAKQITPIKDTSIELKIQSLLKQLKIDFFTHQYIKDIEHGYQCDILIPVQEGINKKTIIECFGTYWHKYPFGREVDIQRCEELREQGWKVLVLWENEIKVMELNNLKEVLVNEIQNRIC